MRDVAVISFAQSPSVRRETDRNEVEMLMPVVTEAIERSGLERKQIGFTCSGSSDYLCGVSFSFVTALDAIAAWPPIVESHVEMDGAWALYEAWVRIQTGEVDTALAYGFGRSSLGDIAEVLSRQLDPYLVAPLWPDAVSVAALQARALIDAGAASELEMAEVAVANRKKAMANDNAQVKGDFVASELLESPYIASPLRKHDCAPISDGVAAVVLAAGDVARRLCKRPAWISGIDHRVEAQALGCRDLTRSPSTTLAAEKAGAGNGSPDVAEVYAPFSHQEIILRKALGLAAGVELNPSGGALAANPIMAAGLIRIGEAASRIMDGSAGLALAHATSGPCLQQNLVCMMEAR
ncbi:MAG: thiolase domain-containing protein [Deltaproteobacteria bacterium]